MTRAYLPPAALCLLLLLPAHGARPPQADSAGLAVATFAGGPFWGLEAALEAVPGVRAVVTGYLGGADSAPTYDKVVEGDGGQVLAVEVHYDPKQVRYLKLAEVFWRQIDPLTQDRQFNDTGPQYHTALYWRDSAQKRDAEASLIRLQRGGRFKKPIAAAVEPLEAEFHPAEEAQQDYYRKHPGRYRAWMDFSGRRKTLDSIWGTGSRVKALPSHSSGKASQ